MMINTKYEPADIEIYVKNKGLVFKQKSLIAYNSSDGKILAVGSEAEQIASQQLEKVCVVSPLRRGMIADYRLAVSMFQWILKQIWEKKLLKPHVAVGIPQGITEVEKKALEDMVFQMGARNCTLFYGDYESFTREMKTRYSKDYEKYQIFIIIGKYEPERYIAEELSDIVAYAHQEGISADRVCELLAKIQE